METSRDTSGMGDMYLTRAEAENLIAEKVSELLLQARPAEVEQAWEEAHQMALSAQF